MAVMRQLYPGKALFFSVHRSCISYGSYFVSVIPAVSKPCVSHSALTLSLKRSTRLKKSSMRSSDTPRVGERPFQKLPRRTIVQVCIFDRVRRRTLLGQAVLPAAARERGNDKRDTEQQRRAPLLYFHGFDPSFLFTDKHLLRKKSRQFGAVDKVSQQPSRYAIIRKSNEQNGRKEPPANRQMGTERV